MIDGFLDRTVAPPVRPFADINLVPERVETLPNGLILHIVNTGSQPISRLVLVREGGSLDAERPWQKRLMAEAMRENTVNMDGEHIADIVDYNGARLGSSVHDHFTRLDMLVLNRRMPELLPLMRDIMLDARFTERSLGVVAGKAAANRAIQLSKVSYVAANAARRMVTGTSHPASVIATPEDFTSTTVADVSVLYEEMLGMRMHAFIGGAFDEGTLKTVRDFLGAFSVAASRSICVRPYEPSPQRRVHVDMPQAMQAAVSMMMPAIGRDHPDYIDLRLTIIALGGYFGSRLMSNIREDKGLTYGINAALLGSREGAYMEIGAQCDRNYVEQVIEETVKEIDLLRSDPPRADELQRLKLYAWTSLAAAADSAFGTLDHYITRLMVGTPHDYFARQMQCVASLTPDRIAEIAGRYLDAGQLCVATAY
ncbi:MAG: insulinase family protein [Muribaculaceae bacterium]|nr:insulinase family protein [Muribaculaceae bacterium]